MHANGFPRKLNAAAGASGRFSMASVARACLVAVLCAAPAVGAGQAAAEDALDTSFGIEGVVNTDFNSDDLLYGSAIDSSGRIIAVGGSHSTSTGYNFVAVRYREDGSHDPSFGQNGRALADFTGFGGTDVAKAVAIDSKGRIVLAGSISQNGSYDIALARFTADGHLDPDFGLGGKQLFDSSPFETANALAIDSSDRVIVAGQSGSDGIVFRLKADGVWDLSFTRQLLDFGGGADNATAVAIDGEKIVVAGDAFIGGRKYFSVVRLTANGLFDPSFNLVGKVTTGFGSGNSAATSMAIDASGRIVVAGWSVNGDYQELALTRLHNDGRLDATCSRTLKHSGKNGAFDTYLRTGASSVAIDALGRIFLAGTTSRTATGPSEALVARLSGDCKPDGFGSDGIKATRTTSFGSNNSPALGTAVKVDSAGRIVVAGWAHDGFTYNFGLARFLAHQNGADLAIDFGSAGLWVYANDSQWKKLHGLSPESVVTGDLDGNGIDDLAVDFGGQLGLWVWQNNATWVKVHGLSPESMVTGDLDGNGKRDLVADFGSAHGVFAYMYGVVFGSPNQPAWVKIHGSSPDVMATGDLDNSGKDDLILGFGPSAGTWVWKNNITWMHLHAVSPEGLVTADVDFDAKDELVIDFGPQHGVWMLRNGTSWERLHQVSPESMVAGDFEGNGADDIVLDFGTSGLWSWKNGLQWMKIHASSPRLMTFGNLDGSGGDELILSDLGGTSGAWMLRNNATWQSLHGLSPQDMAAGKLD